MTRAENVAKAQALRADEGLSVREIAERMGVGRSTASAWLADPDLAKQRARRKRYEGSCQRCGGATTGCNGADAAPALCRECFDAERYENRIWKSETIIAAIRTFAAENGRPPTASEWMQAPHDSRFPFTSQVLEEFGRWADAIHAAGFETYSPMQPNREESAARTAQIVAMYESGLGMTTIAARLGLVESSVQWHLDKAGIKRRSLAEATRLRCERQKAAA